MLEASSDLPDNVAALQAMIALQNEKLSIFKAEIKERDYRIEKLEHQLAGLRRHRFGARSEALDQLELTLEEEEIARAVETLVGEDVSDTSNDTPKGKPKRKPLPDHLPRNDEILSPGSQCRACGGVLKTLGEDVTEELEYIPGRFVVNRIIRPRRACCCCEAICQSPLPSRPIEKGRPGPGLLAHVLVNKYADHLPLYRQSQIFEREGVDLDRSTLADWIGKSAALLEPLADAIQRHVLRVRPETLCRITEFSEHESNGRELDEGERVAVEVLPVLGQSAAAVEPGDGAFDHPTPGLDDEALHPIGSLDDLGLEIGQDAGQGAVKDRPLIGAVGEQFPEKGKQTEQGRQQRETAVAILNVGGGDDAVQQQALRIDQNMPLLALDQLAGIEAVAVDASPPFSALFTL